MKVQMTVKHLGAKDSESWTEDFDSNKTGCLVDAENGLSELGYSQMIINYFNDTLRPGETARELISAKEI